MKLTPLWLKYRLQDWRGRFPLVRRTTLQREKSRAYETGRASAKDDLAKERKTVEAIVQRLAHTEYRRQRGDQEYMITLRFSPQMFTYGMPSVDEHRYLAREVARQVEREIATSKFIRDANDHERKEGPRYSAMNPPW